MRRLGLAVLVLAGACGGSGAEDCAASAACEMTGATEATCWWKADGRPEVAVSLDGKTPCSRVLGSEAVINHPLCGSGGKVQSVRYDCR